MGMSGRTLKLQMGRGGLREGLRNVCELKVCLVLFQDEDRSAGCHGEELEEGAAKEPGDTHRYACSSSTVH